MLRHILYGPSLLRLAGLALIGYLLWQWLGGLTGRFLAWFQVAMIVGWILLIAGYLYDRGILKPGSNGRLFKIIPANLTVKIMDVLDKYTNRASLEARVAARQRSESLDAVALANTLKQYVVGQDATIDEVTVTLRRRMAQEIRQKPIAVFLFAGRSGIGKTELAKNLAKAMKRGFLFFDMTACTAPEGASTLFGSPKGYEGSNTYGTLTAGLRDNPTAVVLLDEIEKAHPSVMRRFLTAWNDGFVTEASNSEKINTTQAIFLATTNAGAERIAEVQKQVTDRDQILKATNNILKEANFPPEVLTRIDRVFAFDPIEGLDLARIAVIQIKGLVEQYGLELADGGIDDGILFDVMDRANLLQDTGGVRAVTRSIEHRIADPLIDAKARGAKRVKLLLEDGDIDAVTVEVVE
jgi:ATP-dependent Clp protease ATP-binding subunit ClpA